MATVTFGPAPLDIQGVRAGDANIIEVTLSKKGEPLDLSTYDLHAQVRKAITDSVVALTAQITVTDAPAGKFNLAFPGEEVRALLAGQPKWAGVWDLQVGAGESDPTTIAAGKFGAVLDVTRDPL